jgi:hypothetical protein
VSIGTPLPSMGSFVFRTYGLGDIRAFRSLNTIFLFSPYIGLRLD